MVEVAYSPNVDLFATKFVLLNSLTSLPHCIETLIHNFASSQSCEGQYAGTLFFDEDYQFLGVSLVHDCPTSRWDVFMFHAKKQEIIVYDNHGKMQRKFSLPRGSKCVQLTFSEPDDGTQIPDSLQPVVLLAHDDDNNINIINRYGVVLKTISKSHKLLRMIDDGFHAEFVFHKYCVYFSRLSSFIIRDNCDKHMFISSLKCASNGYYGASERFVQFHKGRLYILYPGNNYQKNHYIEIFQPNLISPKDTERKRDNNLGCYASATSCSVGIFEIPESELKYVDTMNSFVISKDDIIHVIDINRGVILKYSLSGEKLGSCRLKHPSYQVGKCTIGPSGELFITDAKNHMSHIFR